MKIICSERGWAGFASRSLSYQIDAGVLTVAAENQYVKPAVTMTYSFSLDAIKSARDFDSHASFNLLPADEHAEAAARVPFNLYAQTVAGRTSSKVFADLYGANPLMSVLVPLIGSDQNEWQLCFNVIKADVIQLRPGDTLEVVSSIDQVRAALPVVMFDQAQANVNLDGYVDLPFKIVDAAGQPWAGSGEADVYVTTTGGALASSKIRTVNKAGAVRLFAHNVLQGEQITVKAGFKYYVNTGSIQCSVQ